VAQYLIRRFLWAILLFLAVTVITYVIFYIAPVSPERAICGGQQATATCIQSAREYLHTDEPVIVQYGYFLGRLSPVGIENGLHLKTPSLGKSFITRQEVNEVVMEAAPVTASLVFGGAILWLTVGFAVGVFSALRPRSLLDRASMVFVLVGLSAHPVWIGLLFSYVFGYRLGWTPITGYCDFFNPTIGTDCSGPVDWFHHMILPWATFAILGSALYVRLIRANVMETMSEDFVRTARAKGAPESRVLRSHILRNAMLPVVTILGLDIGLSLGGAIFTEAIYSLPGLGRTAVNAVDTYDLPVVQGIVVFSTVAIITFNLIVDLLYAWIDPRIRLS
jgi:peptide/nickel transport system permease protein